MTALIVVDLQVDFMPTGMLPVPEGDRVVPLANRLMPHYTTVVATQDWHPADHGSFAANHPWRKPGQTIDLHGLSQVLWPIHCVQGSWGAEFVDQLDTDRVSKVFWKGTDPTIDSYSGFYDNGHRKSTGLAEWLRGRGVTEVHVLGLAADYCVKYTVLDALREGFDTVLIEDATRGVELAPGDVARAIAEMRTAGARIVQSQDLSLVKN
ncbi:Nicotinamidase [Neolewinella maritima]|uniref:nicotinamidase n=1 Tax=Neolewinella maritima TaxID=1383882 RepID=A0ABM9B072_9BACT|nr:bifunctional nicotinamidase/pyrazinamidase [Neolewinella maritima]CAH1000311.1 Nicotinamidase [Neolewinella maritima]